ncbi:Ribokinase-like protein [Piedraia hortae CBS 480.64]|uniref:Ribokinase-like protein n=1 Tax=Piedraia hortae CBS 480.64 TaxID=1314780 RepID=A0A6A7C2G4_9PEZI|nr:Ribokinase-like protein [Piedraia hortae CBS 480.64]
MDAQLDFVSLGMFVLDEIQSASSQTSSLVVGGAGTYSTLGARLVSPESPHKLSFIVDEGPDFPTAIKNDILSWKTSALFRPRKGPTTRGWNGYEDANSDSRTFKYLTPKKQIFVQDLTDEMVKAKSLHLICSGLRCREIVSDLLQRRESIPTPQIVWEPVPSSCTTDEREELLLAMRSVDVVSPNHEELCDLFGVKAPSVDDTKTIEELAGKLFSHQVGATGHGALVVRCSRKGCFILAPGIEQWLPAYFQEGDGRVVDPTGGGNGFLGAFAVALARGCDIVEAARWGSVAASLCIEQVGVPSLSMEERKEKWNGAVVQERLDEFKTRTGG